MEEKFDGTYYEYWKMQIGNYLYGKKLHLQLEESKPNCMSDSNSKLLDRQVLGVTQLTPAKLVAHNMIKEDHGRVDTAIV